MFYFLLVILTLCAQLSAMDDITKKFSDFFNNLCNEPQNPLSGSVQNNNSSSSSSESGGNFFDEFGEPKNTPNPKSSSGSKEEQSEMNVIIPQHTDTTKKSMTPEELALYMKHLWITKNEKGKNDPVTTTLKPYQDTTITHNSSPSSEISPKTPRRKQKNNQLTQHSPQKQKKPSSSSSSSQEKHKKRRKDS
jgi:hypothetical protein